MSETRRIAMELAVKSAHEGSSTDAITDRAEAFRAFMDDDGTTVPQWVERVIVGAYEVRYDLGVRLHEGGTITLGEVTPERWLSELYETGAALDEHDIEMVRGILTTELRAQAGD